MKNIPQRHLSKILKIISNRTEDTKVNDMNLIDDLKKEYIKNSPDYNIVFFNY